MKIFNDRIFWLFGGIMLLVMSAFITYSKAFEHSFVSGILFGLLGIFLLIIYDNQIGGNK